MRYSVIFSDEKKKSPSARNGDSGASRWVAVNCFIAVSGLNIG